MREITFAQYGGHYVGCNPEVVGKTAEARIAELEAALRAILDHHGPGTLGTDEIYEQAVTALHGPRPQSR